ncbi:aminotransferase class V-fold PLP-dependent enzyme [Amycolatopsis magusensis]|uniref:aminotransferase class V-fold PLP-dependent enzyme n=1 Tax=Amycolatopsis magusensis TaxID=882444 RepID=UPI0024A924AF|nr:aminotransferase class V-fold PLP-dependent enzyme [Amycolatopsis magusensis]MDI5981343.1 aminotransferase class V-fold PLP-dependent enzyme [Amycolatopsis magusensis]
MRSAFGERFEVPPGYLNTPSIGVPPASAADAVAEAVARWRRGADRPPDFDAVVAASRAGFAQLIGVGAERVGSGATVSQLISMVAAGLPDGAKVLVAEGDFTSVTFPFAACARRGVTITEAPLAELADHAEGHDLVAVSVVQSADGRYADLDALRATGVPVLLDATQAIGWQPLDLGWADWVVSACYKFLLAPRGAAWIAVHPRAMERTVPVGANWYAGENPWDTVYGLPMRLADGPRSFDLSPTWLSHVGAAVTLPYLASLDLAQVRAHCVKLADSVLTGLGLPERGSAIISLPQPDAPERLTEAGVVCSKRAGRTRLGFHLYNSAEDCDLVLTALRGQEARSSDHPSP